MSSVLLERRLAGGTTLPLQVPLAVARVQLTSYKRRLPAKSTHASLCDPLRFPAASVVNHIEERVTA
jgi:hypothetical protein